MDVLFLEPETTFIKQFDNDNMNIYFTGAGVCYIWRHFNTRRKHFLDKVEEGSMINEVAAAFETAPEFSVESVSYCTIGKISFKIFQDMLGQKPIVRESLIESIISNPYDHEREFFVENCRRHVEFFKKMPYEYLR